MPLLLKVFAAVLVALSACSSSSDDTGTEDPPLAVEIGTGEWEWEDLADGDEMAVIMGPQGGYHFLASVRVSGIDAGDPKDLGNPNNPTTSFSVWFEDQNLTASSVFVQGLDPVSVEQPPFRHEMIGRFAILSIFDDAELEGANVRFSVRVEDVNGTVLEDERVVKAYGHPNNE
jgi:hypothetical protein